VIEFGFVFGFDRTIVTLLSVVTHDFCSSYALDVRQNEEADAKEVRCCILKEHTEWHIPERRVSKFVKRQKKHGGWASDDDMSSTVSSQSFMEMAFEFVKGFSIPFASPSSKHAAGEETLTITTAEESSAENNNPQQKAMITPAATHQGSSTPMASNAKQKRPVSAPPKTIQTKPNRDYSDLSPLASGEELWSIKLRDLPSAETTPLTPATTLNFDNDGPGIDSDDNKCFDLAGKPKSFINLERCEGCAIL